MRLRVTTNWADDFLERIAKFEEIEWINGRLYKDEVGGQIPPVNFARYPNRRTIEKTILKAHSIKKKFCYSLDGHCLGNKEYSWEGQKKILEFLKWIEGACADAVSVSIPYLVEVIKEQFPLLKVHFTAYGMVGEMQRVKYFDKLGADSIAVSAGINRYFKLLKAFKKAVKCGLTLTANSMCLYHCNFASDHINMLSHTSNFTSKSKYCRYYNFICNKEFLDRPEEILKSGFIRPEDIKSYETLGYEDFILELNSSITEDIVNIIAAYTSRSFKGNLLTLMSLKGEKPFQEDGRRTGDVFKLNNCKLEGFLEYFMSDGGSKCYYALCGVECKYCKKRLKGALYCNDNARAEKLKLTLQKRIDNIEDGI